jgi:hypothetical protein
MADSLNIQNRVAADHGGAIRSKAAKEQLAAELKKAGVPDKATIREALIAQRNEERAGKPKEAAATPKPPKEPKGLFSKGSNVDFVAVEKAAEKWRQEAGLSASPGTLDWKHDRVHALTHSFLGGANKIGEWIGQGPKSPTPAEETLVNLVHRDAALKARGEGRMDTNDLKRYITRDIQVVTGRNQIADKDMDKYMTTAKDGVYRPDYDKFIAKYEEMRNTPGFDKLLDAAHASWSNAGDTML